MLINEGVYLFIRVYNSVTREYKKAVCLKYHYQKENILIKTPKPLLKGFTVVKIKICFS